ncbi:MAG: hypothetical protein KJ568_01505 [Actinobacteria bacterium]|nr:hypothetical protein [Actinomycetota bacterium]
MKKFWSEYSIYFTSLQEISRKSSCSSATLRMLTSEKAIFEDHAKSAAVEFYYSINLKKEVA